MMEHEEVQEEQAELQVEAMVVDNNDAPHIDLEGEREKKVYALIKNRVFEHTKAFDPDFLEKLDMNIDFTNVLHAIG